MDDARPDPSDHIPDLDEAGCLRALSILVDIGTGLALEVKHPSETLALPARASTFERVATALRRCILLWRHLAESKPIAPAVQRADTRRDVLRKVQDAIERRVDPSEAHDLRLELLERLDSPDFEHELARRSPAELVTELCNDLGLVSASFQFHHCRRTPDDIAILCAQAAAPAAAGIARWPMSSDPLDFDPDPDLDFDPDKPEPHLEPHLQSG